MFNIVRKYKLMYREKALGIKDCYSLLIRNKFNLFVRMFTTKMLKVMIGLTYKCQCNCSYCGTAIYNRDRKEMSCADFKKIIEDISSLPYLVICISFFGGEPLLKKDLFELVQFTRKKGLLCELDSNGILLTSDNVRLLKEAGLNHIFVSLDSADSKTHDMIKGKKGCFTAALKGIKNCIMEGLSCSISVYVSKRNLLDGSIGKLIALGKELGVRSVRLLPPVVVRNWQDLSNDVIPFNEQEQSRLRSLLNPNFVYLESTGCNTPSADKRCAFLNREFFYISPYGEIQPCPYFPVSFGNIIIEPLNAVINRMWNYPVLKTYNKLSCPANDSSIQEYFKCRNSYSEFPIRNGY